MMALSKPKVLVIAHRDEEKIADEILEEIETKANWKFYDRLYESDPGQREVANLDEKLKDLERGETSNKKILFIVTKHTHKNNWLTYACDVAAQMAWTVPLVVENEDEKIPNEGLDIRIKGKCIRWLEKGSVEKVIRALESTADKDFCLPMAHIAPGMCSNYYFGFINVVFGNGKAPPPDFQQALANWQKNNNASQDTLASQGTLVRRMILLIPESCECKRIPTDCGHYLSPSSHSIKQHVGPLEKIVFRKNVLQPDRTYEQYMYNVQSGGAGSGGAGGGDAAAPAYNAVIVMVSTVNTLYNMRQIPYAGITEDVMIQERKEFSALLQERLKVHKDQVELIEFYDKNTDCDLPKLIYERCKNIVSENAGNAQEDMDTS